MTKANEMTKDQIELLLGDTLPEVDTTKPSVPASAPQIKYYSDLCNQKGQTVEEKTWTSAELKVEIDRLKAMPYFKACSENQINRITELCSLMNMPLPDFSKLNGAYDASASKLIQKLNEMKKNVVLPISEKQIAMITQMQFCPACEVVEDVEAMTSKEASEYIAKSKDEFYGWKKTRLTAKQVELIRELTARTGSELPYSAIIQFDEGTATRYIDELETELADKSLKETTLEPEDMYAIKSKDQEDARNELRNLVAKLYASIGQELEDEFYETMDWNGLKELVEFVKLFGIDVEAMLDRVEIFNAQQKASLLA